MGAAMHVPDMRLYAVRALVAWEALNGWFSFVEDTVALGDGRRPHTCGAYKKRQAVITISIANLSPNILLCSCQARSFPEDAKRDATHHRITQRAIGICKPVEW